MIDERLEFEAKERLTDFLKDTTALVRHLVYEGIDDDHRPFFFEDLSDQIRTAWEEFEEDFNINDAIDQINDTDAEKFQASGLYGSQLDLKLSVIDKWKKRFSKKRIKKILLKLLDAIDTVLDSLIAATGMNEALKEIKDILRNSIDE